jgi:hypothetical protein
MHEFPPTVDLQPSACDQADKGELAGPVGQVGYVGSQPYGGGGVGGLSDGGQQDACSGLVYHGLTQAVVN